jgi:prephenate dehydrogenase
MPVQDGIANPQIAKFRTFLASMEARILEMPAEEHDHALAYTSHLPQILSTALAATLAQDGDPQFNQVFGSGLLDMTRLALSSPELWNSILRTNKNQVEQAIDALVRVLLGLKACLGEREMANTFEVAETFASGIRKPTSN